MGNPRAVAARPERAARRPAADGGGAPRRASRSPPAARARAASRSAAARRCPPRRGEPVDAAVRLEVNRYNGAVEPRLVLRHAQPARPAPIEIVGEPAFEDALHARSSSATSAHGRRAGPARPTTCAGSATASAGERRAARRARRRHRRTAGRSRRGRRAGARGHRARRPPRRRPARSRRRLRRHDVGGARGAIRPSPRATRTSSRSTRPPHAHLRALAERLPGDGWTHLAWGGAELELARRVLAWELDLRIPLGERLPRAPRGARQARGAVTGEALRDPARHAARSRGPAPSPAGCCACSRSSGSSTLATRAAARSPCRRPPRTELERSDAFLAYAAPACADGLGPSRPAGAPRKCRDRQRSRRHKPPSGARRVSYALSERSHG